jgi:hypothetical protein
MFSVRCGVLIAICMVASAGAVEQVDQHCSLDHTCTIIRPAGDRGAVVPDTWPGGIVPYQFESDVSGTNQNRVRNAMDMLEDISGVTFTPRANESAYLNIGAFGGNWSSVGRNGGQQDLSIYNWSSPLIICHELIHALGRYHQQSRGDRENYIQVNWDNIDDDYEYNYYVSNSDEFGPYDFESVMHYSQWGFSTGGPTMTCLPGYEQWQNVMGQREYLSDGDIATLQHMYASGTADAAVLFVQVTPNQIEAGSEVYIQSVLKNNGVQAAFDARALIYLSSDAVLGGNDVVLYEEHYAYLLPGSFEYLNVDVAIPVGTADGPWFVGVKLISGDDSDGSNNEYVTQIEVGEVDTCPADISGDGQVDVNDILAIVGGFGDCSGCPEDIDGDGLVGVNDLLAGIAAWGPC